MTLPRCILIQYIIGGKGKHREKEKYNTSPSSEHNQQANKT